MRTISLVATLGFVLLGVTPAKADAIDGDWCSPTGARHLFVEGPQIITPAGAMLAGEYTRHSFAYLAPAGEVEAGKRVAMRVVDDFTMLFFPEDASQPEVWVRCDRPGV